MDNISFNLSRLAKVIPQFAPDFSDLETLEIWAEELRDIPEESLRIAFKRAKKTCDHFPSIARLRRLASGITKSDNERKKKAMTIAEKVWRLGTMPNLQTCDPEGEARKILEIMGGVRQFQNYLEQDHDFVVKRAVDIALGSIEEEEQNTLSENGANFLPNEILPEGDAKTQQPLPQARYGQKNAYLSGLSEQQRKLQIVASDNLANAVLDQLKTLGATK